ncbi:MAG TPA: DUF4129 domain-containing protein [Halomicronema sp.]
MKSGSFENTNLGWQLGQTQQKVAEWVELQFSKLNFNGPKAPPSFGEINFGWVEVLLQGMFWLILALLIVWFGWLIWRLWPGFFARLRGLGSSSTTPAQQAAKPMPTAAEWLVQAAKLSREGDFGLASRCLYMAMLERLNDSSTVDNQPSRTDGEYRELLKRFSGRKSCEVLLSTHERLCFGEMPVTGEEFERCQEAFRKIEKL